MEQVPAWIVYTVGISNAVLALGMLMVGIVLVLLCKQILTLLIEVQKMLQEDVRRDIMPSVSGTLKNVEKISRDAADTTHNVTGAVNRVSNLVGAASSKLESPIIRAVGLASGLLAASRAAKGGGKKQVVIEKKRKGFFG